MHDIIEYVAQNLNKYLFALLCTIVVGDNQN